jgi:hypothetical protein
MARFWAEIEAHPSAVDRLRVPVGADSGTAEAWKLRASRWQGRPDISLTPAEVSRRNSNLEAKAVDDPGPRLRPLGPDTRRGGESDSPSSGTGGPFARER